MNIIKMCAKVIYNGTCLFITTVISHLELHSSANLSVFPAQTQRRYFKSSPTKVKHIVPALTKGVPWLGEDGVQPGWHGHGEQGEDKHGVDGLDEAVRLRGDVWLQAANPGLKQHRGNS